MDKGTPNQAPEGQWYKPDAAQAPAAAPTPQAPVPKKEEVVTWTASEFIAHHKGAKWYILLALITLAAAALVWFLIGDWITTAVILFCGFIFGVAAARKPRVLGYRLDDDGLTIADKIYPYTDYKAFILVDEGHFASISLIPLKRFMPAINLYFDPNDEQRIVDVLSTHLPLQPGGSSGIDKLMRRVRF